MCISFLTNTYISSIQLQLATNNITIQSILAPRTTKNRGKTKQPKHATQFSDSDYFSYRSDSIRSEKQTQCSHNIDNQNTTKSHYHTVTLLLSITY